MSIVINPTTAHSATVIFLHGMGDSGHGWAPVMRVLSRSLPFVKFILPHAPPRSITMYGGTRMPSWYDIYSLDERETKEDNDGLVASKGTIVDFIEIEKAAGIPASRIVVGGFSQGGAVSLFISLTGSNNLAGVISLSAYLPLRSKFNSILGPYARTTPIFIGHGTSDAMLPFRWGAHAATHLKSFGCNVVFKSYENLEHSCNDLEIEDVREFLAGCFCESDQKYAETL